MKQISQDSEKRRSSLWSAAARRRFASVRLDAPAVTVESNFSLSQARQAGPWESGVKPPHSKMRSHLVVLGGLLILVLASEALAVAPPQSYDFEGLASNSLLSSVSGWDASSNTVVVLPSNSIPVSAGTNAVILPAGAAASNLVQSLSPSKVWTDLQFKETVHMADATFVEADTNAVFQFYMTTNGSVMVYDRTAGAGSWVSYSEDVWGNPVSGFAAGSWTHVSVLKDYATHKASVFVNDHLIREQLDFINTNRNTYLGFSLGGSETNSTFLDEVGVLTNVPASLTNDVDLDGMADAKEMQTYGNVSTWRRWTNTVSVFPGAGGTVMPGTLTYSNGTVVVNDFLANSGYGISSVQSNFVSVSYGGDAKSGTVSYVIYTDTTFSVSFEQKTNWSVPADVATLTRAVAVAAPGDTIIASNGLTTSESITMDKAVTLTGTNVAMTGTLAVSNGVTAVLNTASNWVIGIMQVTNAAVLIVMNSTVTVTSLSISGSGVVRVTNSTVTANGLTLTGTFTLDSAFGVAGVTASHLNFSDDFERYELSTPLNALGMFGWGASSVGVIIQSNTTYLASGRAVLLPAISSLTNFISSAGFSNVWTECALNDSNHMVNGTFVEVDTNAVVQLYMNTNRYVVLYNRASVLWEVCSNDASGVSLDGVYSDGWAHIAVNQNYATKKVALFLNGHLIREQVAFINTNQGSFARFQMESSGRTTSYLDNVAFTTNVPSSLMSGLNSDLDHDGIPDAVEIAQYGSVSLWPRGSVFKIR